MRLVEKIENSFKNFKKKQKIFLDNLKVLWNRIYFENGQEFRDYIDRHTIREKEKLTANNPKTKFDYFLKKIIWGFIFKKLKGITGIYSDETLAGNTKQMENRSHPLYKTWGEIFKDSRCLNK